MCRDHEGGFVRDVLCATTGKGGWCNSCIKNRWRFCQQMCSELSTLYCDDHCKWKKRTKLWIVCCRPEEYSDFYICTLFAVIKSAEGFFFCSSFYQKRQVCSLPLIYIYISMPLHEWIQHAAKFDNFVIVVIVFSLIVSSVCDLVLAHLRGTKIGCLESQGWDHLMSCC